MLKSQTSGDAAAEARSFFALLKSGRATLPQIRSQIGYHTPYRRRILLCFDVLRGEVTPELRTAILSLLRANSLLAVSHKLSVPYKVVRKVSKEGHARFHKIGRGRKLASETEECILDRIRADARSVDLRREFGVSDWYVQKLRRSIGDKENRLFRRGWNEQKVKEALQDGLSISEVERDCGIQHAVLWKLRKKIGDTEDRRRRKRPMPEEKRAAIFADIRIGLTQRALAKKHHLHTDRVRAFQIEAGSPTHRPRCFTSADVARIRKLIHEGKSNGEIARELKCTSSAIWLRRKREGQKNQEAIAA